MTAVHSILQCRAPPLFPNQHHTRASELILPRLLFPTRTCRVTTLLALLVVPLTPLQLLHHYCAEVSQAAPDEIQRLYTAPSHLSLIAVTSVSVQNT